MDYLTLILAGLGTLGAGGYAWSWQLHRIAMREIQSLWVRLTNHQEHEIDELKKRIARLEKRPE